MARSHRRLGQAAALLALFLLLATLASRATATLQINYPPPGAVVQPGQTLTVLVGGGAGVQSVGVVSESPLPDPQATSSPSQFALTIPAGLAPGTYHLTAIGSLSGGLVRSEPLAIDVERSDDPTRIRVEPATIRFRSGGERIPLRVIGTYDDGSQTTVTGSSRTTFQSHDTAVATVDGHGVVTAVAPGKTTVQIDNARASYAIPVQVLTAPSTSLLLGNGRFRVDVRWTTSTGSGDGMPVQLTPDTGYFWFFNAANVEMVVKVLNGCSLGGHYWVFAGGLTNVKTVMVVTDTQRGTSKTYNTPAGQPFTPIQDTSAFATCP